jgi:hypothetical protein
MKDEFTTYTFPAPIPTPTLDKVIADAQAKREQDKAEHEKTMALLNQLKRKSIFDK